MRMQVRPLASPSGFMICYCRDVGQGQGLDPALLWLRGRLAATVQIQHLDWEFPYAAGVALKRQQKKKKKKKKKKKTTQKQKDACMLPESFLILRIIQPIVSWHHLFSRLCICGQSLLEYSSYV